MVSSFKRLFLFGISCCTFSGQIYAGGLTISPTTLDSNELSEVSELLAHRMKPLLDTDYKLLSISKANLLGREGLIICVESEKQKFLYSSPYAFMKTSEHMYNLGGDGFCDLKPGAYHYREYGLKRASKMRVSKSDLKKIRPGKITIEFSVSGNGKVENIKVIKNGTGSERAEKIATWTMSKYRYRPRVIGSSAVSVHGIRQNFNF